MSREQDLLWYVFNREALAERYHGEWLVILGMTVMVSFRNEKDAVEFAVRRYGINQASIFQAVPEDPFMFA